MSPAAAIPLHPFYRCCGSDTNSTKSLFALPSSVLVESPCYHQLLRALPSPRKTAVIETTVPVVESYELEFQAQELD